MHQHDHNCNHSSHDHHIVFEQKTFIVFLINIAIMIAEIVVGWLTNSMALLAEGWHNGTHVFAIGITWLAYKFSRKYQHSHHISFNKNNLLSLAGYTNAVVLLMIAFFVLYESTERLFSPLPIDFNMALIIAVIGLIVNIISAKILHHDHSHSDHNMKAAYFHVLADILTSLLALVALLAAKYFTIFWVDALSGIIGSIIIFSWSYQLIKNAGGSLIELKRSKDLEHTH